MIDREIGPHSFSSSEYAVLRRVIHATADFEFQQLIAFQGNAIESAIAALKQQIPIVTDVAMVAMGITTMVQQTFQNPIYTAVTAAPTATAERTRSEMGLLHYRNLYPDAIYLIGNAPTALLALCQDLVDHPQKPCPACVVGAPVGFVAVTESKAALAEKTVPQIRIDGRKGGSPATAAIANALLQLAWESQ